MKAKFRRDNDSDEETDPWGVLVHEAAAELGTKHNELVQSHENDGFKEIDAKNKLFWIFNQNFERN